jgi:hypothetical protein
LLLGRSLTALDQTEEAVKVLERARELIGASSNAGEQEMRVQIEREIEQLQARPH